MSRRNGSTGIRMMLKVPECSIRSSCWMQPASEKPISVTLKLTNQEITVWSSLCLSFFIMTTTFVTFSPSETLWMPGETVRNTYKHFCLPTWSTHIANYFVFSISRPLKRNATNAIWKIGIYIYMHDDGCYFNLLDWNSRNQDTALSLDTVMLILLQEE